ncbi:hypothetical protein [Roseomonas sp. WA12]
MIVELHTFRDEVRQNAVLMRRVPDQIKSFIVDFQRTTASTSKQFQNDAAALLHLLEDEHLVARNERREFLTHFDSLVRNVEEKVFPVQQSYEEIPIRLRAILADHASDLRRQFEGAEAVTSAVAQTIARQAALDELRTWRQTDPAFRRGTPSAMLLGSAILIPAFLIFVLGILVGRI